jgi:hypothetical protein
MGFIFVAAILKMEPADSYETLESIYQITRRYMPEDPNPNKIKSNIYVADKYNNLVLINPRFSLRLLEFQ